MRRTSESESADFVISHPNPKIRKNHIRFITSLNSNQEKNSMEAGDLENFWCFPATSSLYYPNKDVISSSFQS